jgi:hypothetical protein
MKCPCEEWRNELENLELKLLQEIWQLESSLLELIRQFQDFQLSKASSPHHKSTAFSGESEKTQSE